MASEIERRPGVDGVNSATFPRDWGAPPADTDERRSWIMRNILDGEERRAAGEHVPWLAERERR